MANPVQALSEQESVTIANGAALSGAINLGGRIPDAIYMPAAWTAAGLSFQASPDGATWYEVYSEGAAFELTAAAAIYMPLDFTVFYGAAYLKIRSGTSGVPVNQAAARTLILMTGTPNVR